ncbi:S8 family serine peptidase [Spirosoma sp. KCTC 42546]|uniref:S8 family serine peptidase n=1 Tax=Spirosoma sp. KCTC 42546 TaxID=2520506 RepID=UPI001158A2BC|nr:S8 family serine peptidase [Spirosoma sp. KCTC 42546]QDK82875.1 S8 family serine peptidase [Spirosoma sp. KCTC 42546]
MCLIVVFLSGVNSPAWAQPSQKKQPLSWQNELIERYTKAKKRTLKLAFQNKWSLYKNYSNQRVFQLQEVDALGQPIYYSLHNVEAARGTRTLALQGGGSLPIALSGNSSAMAGRLGLWDGGRALATHQEFSGSTTNGVKITQKDNVSSTNNHTTHLAGTLVGKGVNPLAKGMAFGAQLSVWDYTDDVTELLTAAPNLLISNHAYGPVVGWVYNASRPGTDSNLKWEWWGNTAISATEDYLFGFYTTKAQDLDRIAYNNPYFLMVRSADNKRSETGPPTGTAYFLKNTNTQSTVARSRNDAYDVVPAEATAKNVLTIGAADVTYDSQNQPVLVGSTSFSGWGPTDDGRIKPDLLGIGTDVLSSIATTTTDYSTYSGTSMASANVSGSLFLLQELYARQRASGLPASGQFMRAATLKGLAIHTADRPTPAIGPDYRQGWGLLNTEAAARLLLNEELAHLVLEQSLTPGGIYSRSIVAQGNEPLIVTLSWTDPEGTATSVVPSSVDSQTPKLVNDLDLRISDGQQTNLPFVLDPARPALPASRGDNVRDNVEQVYIANPIPGKAYTLTVSHKGKMTYSSQPYSLLVSGLHRINCQLTATTIPAKDTIICSGATLPLQAGNQSTDFHYQWLLNGTVLASAATPNYHATQAGSYTLRITDGNGCSATSPPVQVQVRTASIGITPTGNQLLCNTDTPIRLEAVSSNEATLAGATFNWLRNNSVIASANASTFNAIQPGRYQVRMTQGGCTATSTEAIVQLSSVNNLDLLPVETELNLPKGASVMLKAPIDTSYRYQWYRNDSSLPNAHEYRLSVSTEGSYKVQITQHTCVGWSTNRIVQSVALTAATSDSTSQFIIYPNPTEQTLSIRYANPLAKQVLISVLDQNGILQQPSLSIKSQNGQFEGDLPIQQLPAGIYIFRLADGFGIQTGRFVKK